MNMLISMVALLIVAEVASARNVPSLVTGRLGGAEYAVNDTLYLIGKKRYDTLFGAASHCQRWGGKIASIPNQETLDTFKRLAANTYLSQPYYWIGVFSECLRELLLTGLNDTRAYKNCTEEPDNCYYYGAGPHPPFDLLLEAFDNSETCNFTKWVNIDGEEVTFLPFGDLTPAEGHHCTSLDVFDCENEEGCIIGEYSNHECFADHHHAFICEKPIENCPTFMEVPNPDDFFSPDELRGAWDTFFGGRIIQCGYRYARIVFSECARRYVDLRGIRIDVPNDEDCYAVDDNVLIAEVGNAKCGATTQTQRYSGFDYILYTYAIRGELGEHGPPADGDIIRRDTSVFIDANCDYETSLYTDLNDFQYHDVYMERRVIFETNMRKNGSVEVTLSAYKDMNFTMPLSASSGSLPQINVPEMIYVQAASKNNSINVEVTTCWVSQTSSFDRNVPNFLIVDSCTFQNETQVISPAEFGFASFVFNSQPTAQVFIHCEVKLCSNAGCQGCNKKRRRDVSEHESKHLFIGPITFLSKQDKALKHSNLPSDLCEKKACEHTCHLLGSYAMCACPSGMNIHPNGRTCVIPELKWDMSDDKAEGSENVAFEGDNLASQHSKKLILYSAMATFAASCILCYTVFRISQSKRCSHRASSL